MDIYIYICIYINVCERACVCVCVCLCIYVYTETAREKEREQTRHGEGGVLKEHRATKQGTRSYLRCPVHSVKCRELQTAHTALQHAANTLQTRCKHAAHTSSVALQAALQHTSM